MKLTPTRKALLFSLVTLLYSRVQAEKDESGGENVGADQFLRHRRRDTVQNDENNNDLFDLNINDNIQTRIVGGTSAKHKEFPAFVDLELGCGGSLISSNLVLTAAHCLSARWSSNAWISASQHNKGIKSEIIAVGIHPLYDPYGNKYDFAIMRLKEDVTVTPVVLNRDVNKPSSRDALTAIGLGAMSQGGRAAQILQKVTIPYVTYNTCSHIYQNMIDDTSMMCAGKNKHDTCHGDSGAPLMDSVTNAQVGLVSFGVGCGKTNYPGVYSRVTGAIDWIDDQICLHATKSPPPYCLQKSLQPITFEINYDLYPSETSWKLKNSTNDETFLIVPRGTGVIGSVSSTYYLPPGSYTFEMDDTVGDGICCQYGTGNYTIIGSGANSAIQRNGIFTTTDIVTFEVLGDGSITENENSTPKKSHEVLVDITYDLYARETEWKITNLGTGAIEKEVPLNSQIWPGLITTPLNLRDGSYLFEIKDSAEDGIYRWSNRPSVALYEKNTITGKDKILAQHTGDFGAKTDVTFILN